MQFTSIPHLDFFPKLSMRSIKPHPTIQLQVNSAGINSCYRRRHSPIYIKQVNQSKITDLMSELNPVEIVTILFQIKSGENHPDRSKTQN